MSVTLCLSVCVFLVYPKIVGSSINSDKMSGVFFFGGGTLSPSCRGKAEWNLTYANQWLLDNSWKSCSCMENLQSSPRNMFFLGGGLFFSKCWTRERKKSYMVRPCSNQPTDSMGWPSRLILGCNELMIFRLMVETVLKGHLPCQ